MSEAIDSRSFVDGGVGYVATSISAFGSPKNAPPSLKSYVIGPRTRSNGNDDAPQQAPLMAGTSLTGTPSAFSCPRLRDRRRGGKDLSQELIVASGESDVSRTDTGMRHFQARDVYRLVIYVLANEHGERKREQRRRLLTHTER
jgi:hypothetical protein